MDKVPLTQGSSLIAYGLWMIRLIALYTVAEEKSVSKNLEFQSSIVHTIRSRAEWCLNTVFPIYPDRNVSLEMGRETHLTIWTLNIMLLFAVLDLNSTHTRLRRRISRLGGMWLDGTINCSIWQLSHSASIGINDLIGCFYWHDCLSCCSNMPAIMESSSLSPWPPYWAVPQHPLMQSIHRDTLLMSPTTARLLLSIMNTQGIVREVPPFLPQRDPNLHRHHCHVQQSRLAAYQKKLVMPYITIYYHR